MFGLRYRIVCRCFIPHNQSFIRWKAQKSETLLRNGTDFRIFYLFLQEKTISVKMNNVIKNSAYLLLLSAVLFLSGCSGEQFHVRRYDNQCQGFSALLRTQQFNGLQQDGFCEVRRVAVILLFQARSADNPSSTDCESPTKSSTSVSILPKLWT